MNRPTHVAGGCAGWLGVSLLVHPSALAILAGTVLAGAVAPLNDIDNLGAWSRRKKRGIFKARRRGKTYRRVQLVRWRRHPVKSRLSWLITLLGKHREGPCHSLLIVVPFGLAFLLPVLWLTWWPLWLGPAVAVGLASHVGLDLLNERPVKVFWPFPLLVYGLGLRVGKVGETRLIRPLCMAAVPVLFWLTIRGIPG